MPIKPEQVSAQLKRGLPALAVVAGDEPLLIQESCDTLRAAARAAGYEERTVFDAEKGFNWQQVLEAGASLSLFASRRLIEVRVSGALGEEGGKTLQALAAKPPEDVCLIVSLGALDARQRKAAWFTACDRAQMVVYAWPVGAADWPGWVAARVRAAGLRLSADAERLLADRTEGNLLACAQDIEKLRMLHADAPVAVEQLAEAVADSARFGVFDLSDRMLAGDGVGAVRSLARLREEGLAIQEVLGGLMWTLRGLARAAPFYARTGDLASACEQAGVRRFQQAGFRPALMRVRSAEPLGWLRQATRIDARAKSTGGEPAAWEDLLTLVLAASGAATSGPPRRT